MFESYAAASGFDEYLHQPRASGSSLGELMARLSAIGLEQLNQDHRGAEQLLKRLGATFRLYNNDSQASERILPFDPLPRLIDQQDWQRLDQGLKQRLEAIDCFLADIYGKRQILSRWGDPAGGDRIQPRVATTNARAGTSPTALVPHLRAGSDP